MLTISDMYWLKAEKNCEPREDKDKLRKEIAVHVQDYLDRGGKITKIENGHMEGRSVGFDRLFLTAPNKKNTEE